MTSAPLDPDALEREGKLAEAAEAALATGDAERALRLAATLGDETLASRAAASLDKGRASSIAAWLDARGFSRVAAIVHERAGATKDAARAWEIAGEFVRAARLHERTGDVLSAARLLTERLRRADDDEAALALGELLLRQGRAEAAAQALQSIQPASPHYARARRAHMSALRTAGLETPDPPITSDSIVPDPPAATPSKPTEAVLLGRYRLDKLVATTPTGRVHHGVDLLTQRDVAIKVFRGVVFGVSGRDALSRFQREFDALVRLRHPRIVPALAFDSDLPAIVTAWMPGGTLADRLRAGTMSPAQTIEIALALLDALSEAHRLGILHRDVKPSNVLFDANNAAMLADFGAAHITDASNTVTAGLIGTLGYMSPEAHLGRAVDVTADLYSVGALAYEAIVGVPSAPRDVLALTPSRAHPSLGPAHDEALLALLERDPAKRPPSANEAARRLRALGWDDQRANTKLAQSERPEARLELRLIRRVDSTMGFDALIEREVQLVEANELHLQIARAFALAASPALCRIYRVDPTNGGIWVEPPAGLPLRAIERPLTTAELGALRDAITSLARVGGVHGAISVHSIHVDSRRGPQLTFPVGRSASASIEDDWKALSLLGVDLG
ncbi:MAG: serine/threonine-protein kinase [Polyangiaceae bacterium]